MNTVLTFATALWTLFFKPVVGSVNGVLIPAEIKKAIFAGLGASTLVGGVVAALNAVKPDLPSLFTSPVAASAVAMMLTQLVGLLGQVKLGETGLYHQFGEAEDPPRTK